MRIEKYGYKINDRLSIMTYKSLKREILMFTIVSVDTRI